MSGLNMAKKDTENFCSIMSCSGPVHKWYLETATIPVEGIHEKDEIGNYIAVV